MLQFGHNAPGSASTQPASLGPCFGNILKGKRLRRNGGSHKWSTAAHHLFGHEKESPDIEADELEAAGALFSLAAMAAEMEPAQPEDSGGYVPPARRKGGRGAQQQRKRKREPESQRQQMVWKAEQAAAHAPPAGPLAPLQDAESQHAAAHGYSMHNHSAVAAAAGRREHGAGGLQAPNGLGSRPAPSSWQAAQQLQQDAAHWRPGQDLPVRSDAQGLPRGVRLPWRRGPNHVYIACMIEQLQEEERRQARRQQLSVQQQPKAAPQPPRQQGFTSFQSQGGAAGGFGKPPARHHTHATHGAAAVGGFEELPAPSQQHHGHQGHHQQQHPHRTSPAEAAAAAAAHQQRQGLTGHEAGADAPPEPHAPKHHHQQQLPGNGLAGLKWEQTGQAAQQATSFPKQPPLREQQAPQQSQGYGAQPGSSFPQQQQPPPALSGTQAFPMLPASLGVGQLRAAAGQAGFQLPDMLQGADAKTMAARMLLQGLNGSWNRDVPFSGAGGLSTQQAAALGMGALGQAPFSLGPLPPGLQAQLAATQAQMVASQAMAQAHVQQQQGGPTFQRDSGQPQGVKAEPVPSEESNKDELSSAILQQHQQREAPHQQQGVLGGDLPQQQGHPHVDLLARLKALSNSAAALNGQHNFPNLNGLNGLPTDLFAAMRQAEQQQQPKNGQRPPSQAAVPAMR